MATVAGTIYLSGCNFQLQYDILSQSQANNTTTVRFYGVLNVTNNYINWSTSRRTWVHYAETSNFGTYFTRGSYTLVQGDFTFTHNSQGDLTQNVGYGIDTSFVSGSDAVNITFPHINRVGVIQSFVGNDLSGNFSATYSTYVSGYTYKLRISIPNKEELAKYNNYESGVGVNLNVTSSTNPDETALDRVKAYLDTNKTNKVILGGVIETYNETTKIGESAELKIECSFIDGEPTFTYTTTELNSKVSALLGTSASTIVKNASNVRIEVSPTAKYGATISKVSVIHNNKPYEDTISPYLIDVPVSANEFNIEVQDNRTNKATQTSTKTLIDYLPVDITNLSMKRVNPTSSNIILNLEATYYQQTFGSTANAPIVKWKLDNGSYTTIPSSVYTIDNTNHKLTITNYVLTNVLDYRQQGQFALYIEDLLTTDTEGGEKGKVLKGIPTFDAGEHDFKVNGKMYLADEDGQNPVEVGQGGDTLPINAIVDYDGSTVPEGYELVEDYSTTEVKTNKVWTDNKPVYRKCITGTTQSGNDAITILSGVSELIDHEIVVKRSGINQRHPLSSTMTNYSSDHAYPLFLDGTTLKLYIINNSYKNQSFYGWVEYTKNS